jgi:hypothetical protein
MTFRAKAVIVATAAALLGAGVVLRPWERAGGGILSGRAARAEGAVLALRAGSSRAYSLAFTTRLTSTGAATRETALAGRLSVAVVTAAGQPALALQLDPLEVRVDGKPEPAMSRRYKAPFVVPIAASGRLGPSLFPPEVAKGDRAVLDGMVRAFQVVLPASLQDAWEESESDNLGTYVASYRWAGGAITKAKIRYTGVHPPALFKVRVLASAVRAEVARSGPWLTRLEGSEELLLVPEAGAAEARVQARFSLEDDGAPTPQVAVELAAAPGVARVELDAGPSRPSAWDEEERAAARRRFEAAGITLATLTAQARSARLPAPALTHDLAAYFRVYPEAAAEAERQLEAAGDSGAAILLNALELAGTPAAQKALLDVAGGGGHSRANRIRALVALTGVETPDPETLERLARDARGAGAGDRSEIASTSLLTLGALAPRAPEATGQQIVGELTDELRSASNPRHETLLLMALENAHAPLTADVLATHLGSPEAQVRSAAARLGQYADGGDPTGTLLDALGSEPNADVRDALVSALTARPADPKANAAILAALTSGREPSAAVRVRMVAYLARQFPAFPANRDQLREYVGREPDRDVTVAILNAIAR